MADMVNPKKRVRPPGYHLTRNMAYRAEALLRIQFKKMPDPKTIAAILATAVFDPNFEDSDLLEDQS